MTRAQPDVLYFGTLVQRDATSRTALLAVQKAAGALRYLDLNLRDGQYTEPPAPAAPSTDGSTS